jgi:hypothetical protein
LCCGCSSSQERSWINPIQSDDDEVSNGKENEVWFREVCASGLSLAETLLSDEAVVSFDDELSIVKNGHAAEITDLIGSVEIPRDGRFFLVRAVYYNNGRFRAFYENTKLLIAHESTWGIGLQHNKSALVVNLPQKPLKVFVHAAMVK